MSKCFARVLCVKEQLSIGQSGYSLVYRCYCYDAVVPGRWAILLLRASDSAIPPGGVWALPSLCSRIPLGLSKVSRRVRVAEILRAVRHRSAVISAKMFSGFTLELSSVCNFRHSSRTWFCVSSIRPQALHFRLFLYLFL